VLSRKSSINKNSFYLSKGVGKLPDYLPNKPGVVGSRGQPGAPYNIREKKSRGGLNSGSGLPNLQSSGGVSTNAYNVKTGGVRENSPSGGLSKPNAAYKNYGPAKYNAGGLPGIGSGGIGGGMGSGMGGMGSGMGGGMMNRVGSGAGNNSNPYTLNYQQNAQGE